MTGTFACSKLIIKRSSHSWILPPQDTEQQGIVSDPSSLLPVFPARDLRPPRLRDEASYCASTFSQSNVLKTSARSSTTSDMLNRINGAQVVRDPAEPRGGGANGRSLHIFTHL